MYGDDGAQVITEWNFAVPGVSFIYRVDSYLRNVTTVTYGTSNNSQLTIGEFVEVLDNVTLLCGAGSELFAGQFLLRIYRKFLIYNHSDVCL